MGHRIVKISVQLIQQLLTQDAHWRDTMRISVGLPEGAIFLRGWYEGSVPTAGAFVMVFAHKSWEEDAEGATYKVLDPIIERQAPNP